MFLTATQLGEASDSLGNDALKIGLEHFTPGGLKRKREDDGVVGSENNFSRPVGVDGGETVPKSTNACLHTFYYCNKIVCLPGSFEVSSKSVDEEEGSNVKVRSGVFKEPSSVLSVGDAPLG